MDSFVRMLTSFTRDATIDNCVFRIHYRVTFTILVVFAGIVGFEVYLGEPIRCVSNSGFSQKDLNSICWLQSTYLLLENWDSKTGLEVTNPGLSLRNHGKTQMYYNNYHRVLLALCLQALFFYLPRYFWKRAEGGKIYQLCLALQSPFLPDDDKEAKKRFIAEYMASNKNSTNHLLYFIYYALAELMNFINAVAQVIFMNVFLGGGFSSKVLKHAKDIWYMPGRQDALLRIFPRVTACSFHTYLHGDITRHSAICTLPINPISEKIYVFLWFWCNVLAVISFFALVYRALTVIPRFRSTITFLRVRIVKLNYLSSIVNHCGLGDWLILDLLAKNLDSMSFRDVVKDLVHRFELK